MFTGIVLERGRLIGAETLPGGEGRRFVLEVSPSLRRRLEAGASLAVNGVCLTVTGDATAAVTLELSPETLARTTLGTLSPGAQVNLEPALAAGEALGGHWVQGHVDGTVAVTGRRDRDPHRELTFELPAALSPYVVEKGSVTVDGVSLTVAALSPGAFTVALVPHTLAVTGLGELQVGDRVNLEVDILAKYVERAVAPYLAGLR
jgi:riboflavin synthase